MNRGDVYKVALTLPDRATATNNVTLDKYVVVLQGGPHFATATEVALVIASTFRGTTPRPFEVLVGRAEGFHHDTVIDCRWPVTVRKSLVAGGSFLTHLSDSRMKDVALALVNGLQFRG